MFIAAATGVVAAPGAMHLHLAFGALDAFHHQTACIDIRLRQTGRQKAGAHAAYLGVEFCRHGIDGEDVLPRQQASFASGWCGATA